MPSSTIHVTGWFAVNVRLSPRGTVTGDAGVMMMGAGPSGGCGAEMDEAVTAPLVPAALMAVRRYV